MKELLIVSLLGVAVLGLEVLRLRKIVYPLIAVALMAVCACVFIDWNMSEDPFGNGMLRFDNYALAFTGLFAILTLLWLVFSRNYFGSGERSVDLYALSVFSLCGAMILASYQNMVMLFLGVEILSIPVYVLAASKRGNQLSNEAGFKYFFLGAVASAILLLGIALLYGATGTFDLTGIQSALTADGSSDMLVLAGVVMMLVGFAFKISVAPFHFWAPDVYQGAPTMVTAFMATVVKSAAFAGMVRFFLLSLPGELPQVTAILVWLVAITLVVANLVATIQSNMKRMLAYSSVAHAGFMLAVLLGPSADASSNLLYYGLVYGIGSLVAFSVLYHVAIFLQGNEELSAFNGLVRRNPVMAGAMTLALLSMAGIPPLGGFMAKYLVIAGVLSEGHVWLAIVMVLTSVVAVYYYLRIIMAMFTPVENSGRMVINRREQWLFLLLSLLMVALFAFPAIVRI